jgi:hypothetical protein
MPPTVPRPRRSQVAPNSPGNGPSWDRACTISHIGGRRQCPGGRGVGAGAAAQSQRPAVAVSARIAPAPTPRPPGQRRLRPNGRYCEARGKVPAPNLRLAIGAQRPAKRRHPACPSREGWAGGGGRAHPRRDRDRRSRLCAAAHARPRRPAPRMMRRRGRVASAPPQTLTRQEMPRRVPDPSSRRRP